MVVISGRVMYAIGLVLILILPLQPALRGAGGLVWAILGYWEIRRLERDFRQCVEIRIHSSGDVEIADDNADWSPAILLPGSLVLRKLGWLRLRTVDGRTIVEPVRGDTRRGQDWRRLQVIWRHVGATRRSC
jgi:hypothetical protein